MPSEKETGAPALQDCFCSSLMLDKHGKSQQWHRAEFGSRRHMRRHMDIVRVLLFQSVRIAIIFQVILYLLTAFD